MSPYLLCRSWLWRCIYRSSFNINNVAVLSSKGILVKNPDDENSDGKWHKECFSSKIIPLLLMTMMHWKDRMIARAMTFDYLLRISAPLISNVVLSNPGSRLSLFVSSETMYAPSYRKSNGTIRPQIEEHLFNFWSHCSTLPSENFARHQVLVEHTTIFSESIGWYKCSFQWTWDFN